MQWGNIKTVFILCFLVLDVFLLWQFMEKQKQADISVLEEQNSSIESQLEAENITIGDIEIETTEEPYISVHPKNFTEEEVGLLGAKEGVQAEMVSDNLIAGRFEEPIPLPANVEKEDIEEMVRPYVFNPGEYTFWEWDEELNALIFFQKKNDRPIYYNQSALLIVYLNDQDEMTFYTQTMLGEAEIQENNQTMIQPRRAVEILYNRGALYPEDEVSDMSIGYLTRVPLEDGVQVFAPTYNITVTNESGERKFLVNALEGIQSTVNDEFYQEFIQNSLVNINTLNEDNEMKEPLLNLLNGKLQEENRSETE
ncbi:two-component system regulatory protein YycI [Virgibacillus xinjiangensis]|uniref:Two-component system regulatory protein YycI n=1 Tax=Virgibacillus xinjiangensis TaxID=393090 RepID=A0ABV7CXL4_9BACI